MSKKQYNTVSLIRKKREGNSLNNDEIEYLIQSYTNDEIPDYQMSAFLMAAYLNGMYDDEAVALTHSMLHSGIVIDLSHIAGVKVDKHSTGGVGDKLSLILAPIVAACGVPVPMISGRGLGHSGGTLDKLESIPGFKVDMTIERYKKIIAKHNLVLAGQTEEIAPADKRLYALRDVTNTVESIPLIASSIMSKKLAEGIDALVLDVKFGSGAFMKDQDEALKLAKTLVDIGEKFGKETIAYLTNMDQPLGYAVGNWLEVKESIDCLNGEGPDDVMTITHLLAGTMICLGGKATTTEEGIQKSYNAIRNGSAMQKWLDIVKEQGGNIEVIKDPDSFKYADFIEPIRSVCSGTITEMDTYTLGMASLELGAGRKTKEDTVDPAAGFLLHKKIGDSVLEGETIATVHTNKKGALKTVKELILGAINITKRPANVPMLITKRIDKHGIHEYRA